jgi:hypothetical protein
MGVQEERVKHRTTHHLVRLACGYEGHEAGSTRSEIEFGKVKELEEEISRGNSPRRGAFDAGFQKSR